MSLIHDDDPSRARTYVGFGFGAIQAGLFLYEAHASGKFTRLVVAEVLPGMVGSVRKAGGYYRVNIAHPNDVEQAAVGPIQIEDPAVAGDRERLIEALARAQEIGTAVPSVKYYMSSGPESLHRILAAGLRAKVALRGPRAVVYAAENHNHAAEILEQAVLEEIPPGERRAVQRKVCFLNTVIGKMSGVIPLGPETEAQGLVAVTPGLDRAFLVESFNRILISQVRFPGRRFSRGLDVFQEKRDLLPFEEAKLYGHNATHALAAYLAMVAGIPRIADLPVCPGMMAFLRAAFVEESGAALIHRHAGVDALFTPEGYEAYADDLLARMVNPFLGDTADRVGRDPRRKLAWNDRLIGTVRIALEAGVQPRRYALGAAAALATIYPAILDEDTPLAPLCEPLWNDPAPDAGQARQVLACLEKAIPVLRRWRFGGSEPLERLCLMESAGNT